MLHVHSFSRSVIVDTAGGATSQAFSLPDMLYGDARGWWASRRWYVDAQTRA